MAGPAGSAAATGWRSRFPTGHMVGGNDERRRQNVCGTSRGHLGAGVGYGSLSGSSRYSDGSRTVSCRT